jgi:predicted DsbA family dithiol-disulfide isomerase
MTKELSIKITSDPVCPYCFLGKRKLEKALEQFPDVKFHIEYLPFQLNPNQTTVVKKPYFENLFGGKERAAMLFERMGKMGQQWDIQFNYDGKVSNTLDAHRLLYFSKQFGLQSKVKEEVLSAYHEKALDIGDVQVLATCFANAGGERQKVFVIDVGIGVLELRTGQRHHKEVG